MDLEKPKPHLHNRLHMSESVPNAVPQFSAPPPDIVPDVVELETNVHHVDFYLKKLRKSRPTSRAPSILNASQKSGPATPAVARSQKRSYISRHIASQARLPSVVVADDRQSSLVVPRSELSIAGRSFIAAVLSKQAEQQTQVRRVAAPVPPPQAPQAQDEIAPAVAKKQLRFLRITEPTEEEDEAASLQSPESTSIMGRLRRFISGSGRATAGRDSNAGSTVTATSDRRRSRSRNPGSRRSTATGEAGTPAAAVSKGKKLWIDIPWIWGRRSADGGTTAIADANTSVFTAYGTASHRSRDSHDLGIDAIDIEELDEDEQHQLDGRSNSADAAAGVPGPDQGAAGPSVPPPQPQAFELQGALSTDTDSTDTCTTEL